MNLIYTCLTVAHLGCGSDCPLFFCFCTAVLFGVHQQHCVAEASDSLFNAAVGLKPA